MPETEHESPIDGIIQEEYQRQRNLKKIYENELLQLPKGKLSFQTRKQKVYGYLKYRDGRNTINIYVGPEGSKAIEEMKAKIQIRDKTDLLLKEVNRNIKQMEKKYRAKN